MNRRSLIAGMMLAALTAGAHAAEDTATVFAAASLTDVLQEAGAAFTAKTTLRVRFSFAASSTLARQIESGAPADAFVSADQEWMDYLAQRQLLDTSSRKDIATNSLVLIAPAGSTASVKIAPGFSLAPALGRNGRLATGDPDTVPVGRYARGALEALGAWDGVAGRVIAADNVRTALNFVALGEAPLGIVYATDARGNAKVRVVDTFPAGSHAQIRYPAAALRRGNGVGKEFVEFLRGEEAQGILKRHGFGAP